MIRLKKVPYKKFYGSAVSLNLSWSFLIYLRVYSSINQAKNVIFHASAVTLRQLFGEKE